MCVKEVSLTGPIEQQQGNLILKIPLVVGGDELAKCTKGIGVIEGDFLIIKILPWMAEKLGVVAGSLVRVDNQGGKFNISPANDE